MAIKSRVLKITLILLAIILVLGVLLVGLYMTGVFPAYNQLVRQTLWPQVVAEEKLMEEQQENLLRQQTSIQGLFPHLLSMDGKEAEIDSMMEQTPPWTPVYSCPDEYTLRMISFHEEPVAEDETGSIAQKQESPLWTYVGEYPLVTPPGTFYDAVVFLDAQPALVCLDKSTGTPLMRIPCQVYPGTAGFSYLKSYYFSDRSGKWYEIRFEEGMTTPENLSVAQMVAEGQDLEELFYLSLLPEKNTMEFINAKMNGLLSVTPAVSVPEGILYAPDSGPLSFDREIVSPAFVFSPHEQGTYTLGLCDQDGGWIRDNGFVVLYTMSGEALAISLDYVADRPQITTHLSNQELYVACAGFFPDSLILDAGPSQDFRDNPPPAAEAATGEPSSDGEVTATQGELAQKEDMADLEPPAEKELTDMEVIVLEAPHDSSGDGSSPVVDSQAVKQAWFQVRRAP